MPAHLLLVNPSRPRKRRSSVGSSKKRHFSPAQLAAQARFKAMVSGRSLKKNPVRAKAKAKAKRKNRHVGLFGRGPKAHAARTVTSAGGSLHEVRSAYRSNPSVKSSKRKARATRARARNFNIRKSGLEDVFARPLKRKSKSANARRRSRRSPKKNPAKMSFHKRMAALNARNDAFLGHPTKEKKMARRRRKKKSTAKVATRKRRRRSTKKKATTTKRRRRTSKKAASTTKRRKRRSPKRVRAAKKGARTRRRRRKNRVSRRQRRAEIKMGNRVTRRRRRKSRKSGGSRGSRKAVALAKRARSLRKRAKGKRTPGASIMRARARALSLHSRSLRRRKRGSKGGLSPSAKRMLRASGLMKVNPSVSSVFKDMAVLLPQAGFTIGGMALTAMGSTKILSVLRSKAPSIPGINSIHAPAVLSALLGCGGYVALRMIGSKSGALATFLNKMAPGVFVGGLAAAALHTLSAVKDATGQTLGKRIGLPIGEYVVGEYVVGDYTVGQNQIDVDGSQVRLNGLGSIFRDNTLGALPDPREGARGTRGELHMRDLLDAEEGSLAGSIFD